MSVLYLAEVHKQARTGLLGIKTELKLLAKQESDQHWSTLRGEKMISADFNTDYNAGVLVLVELDAKQQVKSIQDAAKQLVGLLQNFSRMRDKFHSQEEEIEGWKQSLIYQSQELTRREVDMEVRAEELQQLESEAQKIEQQRQAFEASREEILQLKDQIERDRQHLEEGWGRLHHAQSELDTQGGILSEAQVTQVETCLNQLNPSTLALIPLREQLDSCVAGIEQQLAQLTPFEHQLAQDRQTGQQLRQKIERETTNLAQAWQEWHQNQEDLAQSQLEVKLQQQTLALKSEVKQTLNSQIQAQQAVATQLGQVTNAVIGDHTVDLPALRDMPLPELEATIAQLQRELTKLSTFVNDQEEELNLQQQSVQEFTERFNQASEYERLELSGDLENEQQSYALLDQALEGQRQTLQQRADILKLHRDILQERQSGSPAPLEQEDETHVVQALQLLHSQQQALAQSLRELDNQIEQLKTAIATAQNVIETKTLEQDTQQLYLKQRDQELQAQQTMLATLQGREQSCQELLQPLQAMLNESKQQLMALAQEHLQPLQDSQAQQQQALAELQQIFTRFSKASAPVSPG